MNKQPDALHLAAQLDPVHSVSTPLMDLHRNAAAELRRLHAENQALNNALQYSMRCHREMGELAVRRLIRIDELESQGEQEPDAWMHSEGKAQPLYLHPQPKREPQFDAMSVEQERLAEQFCAEIAGPRGGKPSLPDPVRLLEMAEALYRAEAHQNGAIERAHRIGGEA